MNLNPENLKQEFKKIYSENIKRNGADKLLEWLETTDFFTAPASTKYHCACTGGLILHSLNVYKALIQKNYDKETDNLESFTICSLLHDICKAGFYKVATKNVKNDATGVWEKIPFYSIEDNFPYGHGEKSVFLIERFMRLTIPEAMAIRWHMGGFDDSAKSGGFAMSAAFDKFLLCVKLHIADLEATYIMEHGTSEVRR